MIYGIPGQTYDDFCRDIDFLTKNGCSNIIAHPLKLLRGTELWMMRKDLKCKEKNGGEYGIPLVVSCESFSEEDWIKMRDLADSLRR